MKFTRQQRINNTGSEMVQDLTQICMGYRNFMQDGLDFPPKDGYPALKATGNEVSLALGENAKKMEIVLEFVLEGKSNKITKGKGKGKAAVKTEPS